MLDPHGALICTMMHGVGGRSRHGRDRTENHRRHRRRPAGLPRFRPAAAARGAGGMLASVGRRQRARRSARIDQEGVAREIARDRLCDCLRRGGRRWRGEPGGIARARTDPSPARHRAADRRRRSNAAPGPASRRCKDAPDHRPLAGDSRRDAGAPLCVLPPPLGGRARRIASRISGGCCSSASQRRRIWRRRL